MSQVCSASFSIENEFGLHARAATVFVQTASRFRSEITVTKDGRTVNGKSIMGVLMLVASRGSQITVRAEGEDAEAMVAAIARLIGERFGEDR